MTCRGLFVGALLLLASGCASEQPAQQADFERLRDALATKGKGPRTVLTSEDDGLSVRKVVVAESDENIGTVLTRYSQGNVLGEQEAAQFARNGLRLIRVRADDVESMLADLGGPTFDVDEWRGQVLDWSPIFERRVPRGQVLALDGRVNRIASGQIRIMVRSWTLMREDGPFVNVQLRPEVLRIQASNDLRAALEQRPQMEAEVMTTLSTEFVLESGSVYVLVPERPGVVWNRNDAAAQQESIQLSPRMPVGSRVGPQVEIGPDAATPLTLGELILMTDDREGQRGLILLVPHISNHLLDGFAMSSHDAQPTGR
ncbi:MAG TPA: hypothetical protein VG711_06820 [Phycisphaerales bacterium]|nr:hypothetical protein [Phycisphaerales bacterium]